MVTRTKRKQYGGAYNATKLKLIPNIDAQKQKFKQPSFTQRAFASTCLCRNVFLCLQNRT